MTQAYAPEGPPPAGRAWDLSAKALVVHEDSMPMTQAYAPSGLPAEFKSLFAHEDTLPMTQAYAPPPQDDTVLATQAYLGALPRDHETQPFEVFAPPAAPPPCAPEAPGGGFIDVPDSESDDGAAPAAGRQGHLGAAAKWRARPPSRS